MRGRTGTANIDDMKRMVAAVVLLIAAAVLGLWGVMAMYGLASIYADPLGNGLDAVVVFAGPALIVLCLVAFLVLGAWKVAKGKGRSLVGSVGGTLLAATVAGILVAGQLGTLDKRRDTMQPPRCGIRAPELAREFATVDHPGYFGGGEESRTHCAYLETVAELPEAIAHYDQQLSRAGWQVTESSERGIRAERDGLRFVIRREHPSQGDPYLIVRLETRSCSSGDGDSLGDDSGLVRGDDCHST